MSAQTPNFAHGLRFSAVAMGNVVLVFGGFLMNGRVWNMSVSNNLWHWALTSCPDTMPPARAIAQSNCAVVGDSIYIFGGTLDVGKTELGFPQAVRNDVWHLNMLSGVWSHTWNAFTPSPRMLGALAVVNNSILVLFGGVVPNSPFYYRSPPEEKPATNETWLYFTKERRAQFVSSSAPPPRVAYTLAALRNGSLLLFGRNTSQTGEGNELWLLDICQTKFTSTIQYCSNGWNRIGPPDLNAALSGTLPGTLLDHAAAIIEDSMVIVGGLTITAVRRRQRGRWRHGSTALLQDIGRNTSPFQRQKLTYLYMENVVVVDTTMLQQLEARL